MTREAMVARFGGDEHLVGELVELFVVEYPRLMHDVRRSIESGSPEGLRRAAHTLKGCVANFTDTGAAEAAQALEAIGREGRIGEAPEALTWLEREVEALLHVMTGSHART